MSKGFSGCYSSPKFAKDKQDVPERAHYEPRPESRNATSKNPAAARPDGSKKPRARQLSLRRIAIANDMKSKLMGQKAKEDEQVEQGPHLDPDPFVGIPEVFGIQENDQDLFRSFLKAKEAAMVFFYCPEGSRNNDAKRRIQQAARTTHRKNHAYAAINCYQAPSICFAEEINALPSFKLYSHGKPVGYYDDFKGVPVTAADLKRYTETSPVAKLRNDTRKSCTVGGFVK